MQIEGKMVATEVHRSYDQYIVLMGDKMRFFKNAEDYEDAVVSSSL